MIEGFEFVHGDRKFSCCVEGEKSAPRGAWWWFRVSSDDRHRYAPFPAVPSDTKASVKSRIVAYYEDLLARRAAPAPSYWRRGAPTKPAQPAAAVAPIPES